MRKQVIPPSHYDMSYVFLKQLSGLTSFFIFLVINDILCATILFFFSHDPMEKSDIC